MNRRRRSCMYAKKTKPCLHMACFIIKNDEDYDEVRECLIDSDKYMCL